jgi:hypothetical protein
MLCTTPACGVTAATVCRVREPEISELQTDEDLPKLDAFHCVQLSLLP